MTGHNAVRADVPASIPKPIPMPIPIPGAGAGAGKRRLLTTHRVPQVADKYSPFSVPTLRFLVNKPKKMKSISNC